MTCLFSQAVPRKKSFKRAGLFSKFLLSGLLVAQMGAPPAQAAGLMWNPTFDQGMAGWYVASGSGTVMQDPLQTSNNIFRLTGTNAKMWENVTALVTKGSSYTLTASGRLSATTTSGVIGVLIYDANYKTLLNTTVPVTTTSFATYQLQFTVPQTAKQVMVYTTKANAANNYIDVDNFDLVLQTATPAPASAVASATTGAATPVAPATVAVTPAAAVVATPQPVTIVSGGVDTMVLNLSEDAYKGDAQFTVSVDGTQIGGTQTVTATRANNQTQNFTLQGNFGPGAHAVAIDFLNDAWGGTAALDRNLYVNSITLDGVTKAEQREESSSGTVTYTVQGPATAPMQVGVYIGPGCNGIAPMQQFNTWLGVPARHGTENLNQNSWSDLISGVPWELGCYQTVKKTVDITLGIPMLPADNVSTLAQGAAGAYDAYFTSIAQQLVAGGYGNIILRVGWEFNGDWQPWASYKDPANFIKYYQRIVALFRAVPGANFKFDWCPNIGTNQLAAEQSYPGDANVDYIGLDVYDGVWNAGDLNPVNRWNWYVAEPDGLQWQVNFAKTHHKLLSMPEWGAGGNNAGDDPYFVTQLAAWTKANSYTYIDYWNSNAAYEGLISTGQYPLAGAAFLTAFGR